MWIRYVHSLPLRDGGAGSERKRPRSDFDALWETPLHACGTCKSEKPLGSWVRQCSRNTLVSKMGAVGTGWVVHFFFISGARQLGGPKLQPDSCSQRPAPGPCPDQGQRRARLLILRLHFPTRQRKLVTRRPVLSRRVRNGPAHSSISSSPTPPPAKTGAFGETFINLSSLEEPLLQDVGTRRKALCIPSAFGVRRGSYVTLAERSVVRFLARAPFNLLISIHNLCQSAHAPSRLAQMEHADSTKATAGLVHASVPIVGCIRVVPSAHYTEMVEPCRSGNAWFPSVAHTPHTKHRCPVARAWWFSQCAVSG